MKFIIEGKIVYKQSKLLYEETLQIFTLIFRIDLIDVVHTSYTSLYNIVY